MDIITKLKKLLCRLLRRTSNSNKLTNVNVSEDKLTNVNVSEDKLTKVNYDNIVSTENKTDTIMTIDNKYSTTEKTSRRTKKIEYIVIHYTAGTSSKDGSALRTINHWKGSDRQASADFVIDDKNILQYNASLEDRYTWAVGNPKPNVRCSNSNSISIEMCSTFNGDYSSSVKALDHRWSISDKVLNNTIELTKYLMHKYNIDKDHVIRHYDVSGKHCPGVVGYTGKDTSLWNYFILLI